MNLCLQYMKYSWEFSCNALTVPSAEKQLRLQSIWQLILARISANSWSILGTFQPFMPYNITAENL